MMPPHGLPRRPGFSGRAVLIIVSALASAVLLGAVAGHLDGLAVAAISLLPLAAHARRTGIKRALTEPSAATILVLFYLAIFPLRALGMAIAGYANIDLVRGTVTSSDVIDALVLASVATTVLVEAFHFAAHTKLGESPQQRSFQASWHGLALAASVLVGLALAALAVILAQNGGIAGAKAEFIGHTKTAALQGEQQGVALSIWAILSVPSVWFATCYAVDPRAGGIRRRLLVAASGIIVVAHLVIFGSRLNSLLAVLGAWVIYHYAKRNVSLAKILISIPLILVLSASILANRPGGEVTGSTQYERYSKMIGYSVLDTGLAVRQNPEVIKSKLDDGQRWLDLPLYFAPTPLFPDKPSIEQRRLDLFVAQSLGNKFQQETGYPTSYITELWLYGGWVVVLLASALFGYGLGRVHRKLIRAPLTQGAVLFYAFVVSGAFSYYKDGDMLTSAVGITRQGIYVAAALLAFGLWSPFANRRARLEQGKVGPANASATQGLSA
jgi:hypothetical protein